MSWIAVPISAMWLGIAVFLGRAAQERPAAPVDAHAVASH
jgi:hypothetical protein